MKKTKQIWWLIGLYIGGILATAAIAYSLRLIIKVLMVVVS